MTPTQKASKVLAEGAFNTTQVLKAFSQMYPQEFLKVTTEYKTMVLAHEIKSDTLNLTQMNEMLAYIDRVDIVGAIKLVRVITGWGLKDAKEFVDQYRVYLTDCQTSVVRSDLKRGDHKGAATYVRDVTGKSIRECELCVGRIFKTM